MILRPKSLLRHTSALSSGITAAPVSAVPHWLRRAVPDAQSLAGKDVEEVALTAGAAIGALDAVVRQQNRWAGAWRQRLALSAAAVTAKQAGRVEDEAALRDAVLLTRPGDDVGPAGRMLLAWRWLAARPAEDPLTEKNLAAVLEDLGHAHDDEVISDLADEVRQLSASIGMVGMVTGAFLAAERHGFGRTFGCWLVDRLLAQRLGWAHAMPLLGAEVALGSSSPGRSRRSITTAAAGTEDEANLAKSLLAAQARAALRAIDLSAELGRRADRLLAVAPKLRARASDLVIERLLSDDAVVASEQIAGMSDRGLRRLFDRLVELSAVRELSGRPTFRIYGL
ncbi:DUF1403 family protein [Mesorhizobium sp. CA13]|uniref:DUF1403 family protein n=3 Tax=Mesorhizobium TaxID=68287 RepID=UPI0011295ED2|nr:MULTISPECIES: DUF1403 family protein [unclassified Mesorhizobium]MBZ9856407.1 DUF1403 family protein [Mesorhizobium sp. CA13]MBZ9965845.1 DUF1403 family protein [Mesorhizobium sp. BR1-1-2]MCA0011963.1 DUF1403 family protein [Mesorhizobium sp. B294B1A1]MCA0038217.1 DUF1403 family protein [Mesorhizobium sp. B292B1B]TPM44183.1 DUF1403 family protein [Mesorhizobium sp. B2-3-2]